MTLGYAKTSYRRYQSASDKTNKPLEIKNICISEDTTQKVKIQPTKWEKTFANYISDQYIEYKKEL